MPSTGGSKRRRDGDDDDSDAAAAAAATASSSSSAAAAASSSPSSSSSSSQPSVEQLRALVPGDRWDRLRLSSRDFLWQAIGERVPCPWCGRRVVATHCVHCARALHAAMPRVRLPLHVTVVRSPQEPAARSTAVQAKVLAPEDVTLLRYPEELDAAVPFDPRDTVLLYPSPDAASVGDLPLGRIRRVVFVDSTWQKAGGILRSPRLASLPRARIRDVRTHFWRYNAPGIGDTGLATIEAIYEFCREFCEAGGEPYAGQFDDLLLLFTYVYDRIQAQYRARQRDFFRIDGFLEGRGGGGDGGRAAWLQQQLQQGQQQQGQRQEDADGDEEEEERQE